ncbi:MAG: penicillin acylase family protein [Lysobacterales bacterium]
MYRSTVRLAQRLAAIGALLALGFGSAATALTINGEGMRAPGSIGFDANGVPLIQAANDEDAAWLLGYVHARDRLFQMDFSRRAASGTLAELVGQPALANDVQLRNLGLRRAAQTTWSALAADMRGVLKAYADGVNFYVRKNALPPEYGALELTRFEPWSPVDTLAIGKILAFQLSFDLDIDFTLRFGAYQQAGAAQGFNGQALFFEDTHRIAPFDDRISIPGFSPGSASLAAKSLSQSPLPMIAPETLAIAQQLKDSVAGNPWIAPTLKSRENRGASNWWIVSGAETASGHPILANDPHLALDMPAIFHEAHIVSTDSRYPTPMNVSGLAPPGTPGILLGCTPVFCWGLTVNPLDVTDTFQEQLRLNTFGLPTHTMYKGVAEPVNWVFQTYMVNQLDGVPDNAKRDTSIGYTNGGVTVLVPRRNNGPLLSIQGNVGLSAAYTGWGATHELDSIRRINRATNMQEFRAALQYFDSGAQNFAYADTVGNIAYFTSAEAPIREDLQTLNAIDGAPPFLIRDGSGARKNEWLPVANPQPNQALPFEILPESEMPSLINPARNYIANANNDPVGNTLDNNPFNQLRPGGGLYYLNFGYDSLRMGRVDRMMQSLIAAPGKISVADIEKTQADDQMLDAELVLPYLLAAFDRASSSSWTALNALSSDARIGEAVARLADWDFSTPTGITEGYDPGDVPFALAPPSAAEIGHSVAATIFSMWRGQAVKNVIDASLTRVGLGGALPDGDSAYVALKHQLDVFDSQQGVGASGLNFFQVAGAPGAAEARDFLLLKSLADALDLLASPAFAPAFAQSTNQDDYRWGRLHRIEFKHPLGGPFNFPGPGLFGIGNLAPDLPGVARHGGYRSVDVANHNVRANSVNAFMFSRGSSRRFVGEMSDPVQAEQIYPGGQSGVLSSGPAYISQMPVWLVNGYKPLPIEVAPHAAAAVQVLDFVPVP